MREVQGAKGVQRGERITPTWGSSKKNIKEDFPEEMIFEPEWREASRGRREMGLPAQAKGSMWDEEVRKYRLGLGTMESPDGGRAWYVCKGNGEDGPEREDGVKL